jgi:predicted nucleic acid-binding protein
VSRLLYADTGAFIALIFRRDQAHQSVSDHFRKLRASGDRLVTSEPVVAETVTRLRYDVGLPAVRAFRALVEQAGDRGTLVVRESDVKLRAAAFDVLNRFADLRLSYADAVGAAIAEQRRVDAVLGLDHDFRIMGFTLEP